MSAATASGAGPSSRIVGSRADRVPTVRDHMTAGAHTIGREQTLSTAHALMREHGVRHLPVLEAGKLVGIVSQRDLSFVETLRDVDPDEVHVEEAMTADVFTVGPGSALEEVVREMAGHKYGSAVVIDHGRVVGVFTAVDAERALVEMLEQARGR